MGERTGEGQAPRPIQAGTAAPSDGPQALRWRRRAVLAAGVRAAVFVLPLTAGVVAAGVTARVLPPVGSAPEAVLRALALLATATLTVTATERVARRLLPLGALLDLSLLFPSSAPSRLSVALRAGTVRNLERRLQRAREDGMDDEPTRAAETILVLAAALTAHDRWTRGHSERVRAFTDLLAEELGLDQADRDRLRWAALLHDIGKLAVSTHILNKPGPPDEREWVVLHRHPEQGARVAAPLLPWLGPWAATIEQHHERYDGCGYPRQLAGEHICLGARIVAVADAFETMTAVRPYNRRPKSITAAREELVHAAGKQFDPAVVRGFLNISIRRMRWVLGPLAWLAELPFAGPVRGVGVEAVRLGEYSTIATKAAASVLALVMGSVLNATAGTLPRPAGSGGHLGSPAVVMPVLPSAQGDDAVAAAVLGDADGTTTTMTVLTAPPRDAMANPSATTTSSPAPSSGVPVTRPAAPTPPPPPSPAPSALTATIPSGDLDGICALVLGLLRPSGAPRVSPCELVSCPPLPRSSC